MTAHHLLRRAISLVTCLSVAAWLAATCPAQTASIGGSKSHQAFRSNLPPGAIGAMQIARGVAPAGYVQPVAVRGPAGSLVEIASGGGTFSGQADTLHAGLLVGEPYRLKVTNIPRFAGEAVYPSIELIGRLHPPAGEKNRFPVPIELAQEDLEVALRGQMVVRVVYVENPATAFPKAESEHQRYEDAAPYEDPLHVADQLGRPVALVRIGSRTPLDGDPDGDFAFGVPPVEWLTPPVRRTPLPSPKSLPPVINARDQQDAAPVAPAADDTIQSPSDLVDGLDLEADVVPERLQEPFEPAVEPPVNNDTDAGAESLPDLFDADDVDVPEATPELDDPFLDELFPE